MVAYTSNKVLIIRRTCKCPIMKPLFLHLVCNRTVEKVKVFTAQRQKEHLYFATQAVVFTKSRIVLVTNMVPRSSPNPPTSVDPSHYEDTPTASSYTTMPLGHSY